jgi:hypothetical protein
MAPQGEDGARVRARSCMLGCPAARVQHLRPPCLCVVRRPRAGPRVGR